MREPLDGRRRQRVRYLDVLGKSSRLTLMKTPNALLHGTLDALILKTLADRPRHGYGIGQFIEQATEQAVIIEEGSLYPALYRMERRGWIEAEWGTSELGRRAKFYRLTDEGRTQLATETATWERFTAGVSKVLLAQ
jgi:PadR family transcriptional regulator PadR